jgi:hypothetical protein
MRKLVLKQEIPGRFIPIMVSTFLSSLDRVNNEELDKIKEVFRVRLKENGNMDDNISLDFDMYVDDAKGISSFNDFTIIVEMFEESDYNNGMRE